MDSSIFENAAKSLIDNSWLLKLPFGEKGVSVQYGIYSGDRRICPFCYKDLSYDEKGLPVCCEKYNNFRKQIEECEQEYHKIEKKILSLNSKIETEANSDIKRYSLQLAKDYKQSFEKIIKNLEEEIDC